MRAPPRAPRRSRAAFVLFVLLLLLAVTGRAAAAPSLDERLQRIDRETGARLAALAARAAERGHAGLALRLHERALELDAEQPLARKALGWVKDGSGGWTRPRAPTAGEPPAGAEAAAERAGLEAEELDLETARGRQVVAACAEAGGGEAARPHLLRLLDRLPRLDEAHAALGHERIDGRYVRPALVDLARRQGATRERWAACRVPPLSAEPTKETLRIPGVPPLPWHRVGARLVTGPWDPDVLRARAADTECTQRFLALLLGPDAKPYDPPRVVWLTAPQFEAFVKSRHPDPEEQRRRLRTNNHLGDPFVLRTVESNANDIYAHNVAFFQAQNLAAPPHPDDPKRKDTDLYAWWKEGFGYFVTLELWDSAGTSFFSTTESHAKLKGSRPPPTTKTTRTLLAWLRHLVVRHEAWTLEEVVTKSLNALDFVASIQAATFVRFLALYDPEAFRALPAALRAREAGPQPRRVEEALRAAYGKGLGDLSVLWRAWLLELA